MNGFKHWFSNIFQWYLSRIQNNVRTNLKNLISHFCLARPDIWRFSHERATLCSSIASGREKRKKSTLQHVWNDLYKGLHAACYCRGAAEHQNASCKILSADGASGEARLFFEKSRLIQQLKMQKPYDFFLVPKIWFSCILWASDTRSYWIALKVSIKSSESFSEAG